MIVTAQSESQKIEKAKGRSCPVKMMSTCATTLVSIKHQTKTPVFYCNETKGIFQRCAKGVVKHHLMAIWENPPDSTDFL